MDLFGRKRKALEEEIQELEYRLYPAEAQLAQWRKLYTSMKKYDWFEIGAGGAIIAHENNESVLHKGTVFCVPHQFTKLRWD